jgi:hypothetical protein
MIIKRSDDTVAVRTQAARSTAPLASRPPAKSAGDTVTLSPAARRASDSAASGAGSGRTVMLQRLFKTDDASAEPPVETRFTLSGSVFNYLTRQDRAVLARAYEYADERGVDAQEVDALAFDLGSYKSMLPTGGSPDSTGTMFRLDGTPFIAEFSPDDEAAARDILSLKAMDDTTVDHAFLDVVLNPGRRPVHAVNFTFLRELVTAFSPAHSDGETKPNVSFADRDARSALAKAVAALPASTTRSSDVDGEALMNARLFGAQQGDAKPARFAGFLTDRDKKMLGGLYANAQASGADLKEVDKVAASLGALRQAQAIMDAGRRAAPDYGPVLLDAKSQGSRQ